MSDPNEAPFYYTAKASRSERDRGCEHLFYKYEDGKPVRITQEEHAALEAEGKRVTSGNCHATVKPTEIMEWLINRLSKPGDTILDPFAGSGTTGVAAIKTGRNAHLVELNEDGLYEDIIRGRLQAARMDYLEELPVWAEQPDILLPDEEAVEEEEPEEVSFGDLFG